MAPRAAAWSSVSMRRPAPRTRRTRPRRLAARPIEPPISPTPTMVNVSMVLMIQLGSCGPRGDYTDRNPDGRLRPGTWFEQGAGEMLCTGVFRPGKLHKWAEPGSVQSDAQVRLSHAPVPRMAAAGCGGNPPARFGVAGAATGSRQGEAGWQGGRGRSAAGCGT